MPELRHFNLANFKSALIALHLKFKSKFSPDAEVHHDFGLDHEARVATSLKAVTSGREGIEHYGRGRRSTG